MIAIVRESLKKKKKENGSKGEILSVRMKMGDPQFNTQHVERCFLLEKKENYIRMADAKDQPNTFEVGSNIK